MSGGTLGAGPPSPWCAWCGERITVAVLADGVAYHPVCLRARRAILANSKTETLPTQEAARDRPRSWKPGRRITYELEGDRGHWRKGGAEMSMPWVFPPGVYRHPCAKACGLTNDVYTSDLSRSQYQVCKIIKHGTIPSTSSKYVTVFNSTNLEDYAFYVVSTTAAGAVQIDSRHRRNIMWVFGRETGYAYYEGGLQQPVEGMTLVLSSDPAMAHIYPSDTAELRATTCARCGSPAITSGKYLL